MHIYIYILLYLLLYLFFYYIIFIILYIYKVLLEPNNSIDHLKSRKQMTDILE